MTGQPGEKQLMGQSAKTADRLMPRVHTCLSGKPERFRAISFRAISPPEQFYFESAPAAIWAPARRKGSGAICLRGQSPGQTLRMYILNVDPL